MRDRCRNLGYFAAIAALLVGASLLAQTSASALMRQSIGALDTIDTGTTSFKVRVESQLQTIAYDAATIFMDHGERVALASLQRGDTLRVDWLQRDDRKLAVRVTIVERLPAMPGLALY